MTGTCPNCGSALVAEFCASCGERQPSRHDYSLAHMLADAFHELTSVDGRLVRSVWALITKPGLLTQEWFAGRRGRYVKPFSLFVLLNLIFFIIQPHTGLLKYRFADYTNPRATRGIDRAAVAEQKRTRSGASSEAFRARFDATLQNQKKSLLVVCIPLFAFVLAILYAGAGRYFVEHLVFSLHFYTFFLVFAGVAITPLFSIVFGALRLIHAPMTLLRWLSGEEALVTVLVLVLGGYLLRALRRVYGDTLAAGLARSAALVSLHLLLLLGYREALFYTTLYSI